MHISTKRFLRVGAVTVLIGLMVIFASCRAQKKAEGKLTVVASIFPVYDMAREIGGDDAVCEILVSPGTEAHSFEPTPMDIEILQKADIFIVSGAGIDAWSKDLLSGIDNPGLLVVDASSGIPLLKASSEGAGGGLDPHYWLDFDNAKKAVDTITAAFVTKDPAHKAAYDERSRAYKKRLDDLDALYRNGLKECRNREIISSGHLSFGYLARRYDLSLVSVFGISPDAEPTPERVRSVISLIREKNAKYIFAEEMVEPRVAETIEGETGAHILFLSPGDELPRDKFERGDTLLDLMTENLNQLKQGLQCQ
jgi:zinc transport system substrate-binding protein